jgi:hypothetical protein
MGSKWWKLSSKSGLRDLRLAKLSKVVNITGICLWEARSFRWWTGVACKTEKRLLEDVETNWKLVRTLTGNQSPISINAAQ